MRANPKVEVIFEDVMNMMKINREYFQTQTKFMSIRK